MTRLDGTRKTVTPPCEKSHRGEFAYCFDAAASKAPSDEGGTGSGANLLDRFKFV